MNEMLRIGTVSDINESKRTVRVRYRGEDSVSGWLKVLRFGDEPWMPRIDDAVLCLFDGTFNGDGYVLGVTS